MLVSKIFILSTIFYCITCIESFQWSQIGGNIDAGTSNWRKSHFHINLSRDGNAVAIGAPLVNEMRGQVVVSYFDPTNQVWKKMGSTIVGEENYGFAGRSVSLSGDGKILAIGYPGDIDLIHTGRCCTPTFSRVYRWNSDSLDWEQLGSNLFDVKVFQNLQDIPDFFLTIQSGWSVSLSDEGTTVAVGAPNYFEKGIGFVGQVRVYRYDDIINDWIQLGSAINGTTNDDSIGFSVKISGDATTLIVGNPTGKLVRDNDEIQSGLVKVFKWNDSKKDWIQIGNDVYGDEESDMAGQSVSVSTNGFTIAVGIPGHGLPYRSGLVRTYNFDQTSERWDQIGFDITPDSDINNNDGFDDYGHGTDIELSGDGTIIAVAAPSMTINHIIVGLVRVFRFNSTSVNWVMVNQTIPGETRYGSKRYGLNFVSLSSNGNRLVVGAPIHKICEDVLDWSCSYSPKNFANWSGHVRAFDLLPEAATSQQPSQQPQPHPTVNPTSTPTIKGTSTKPWQISSIMPSFDDASSLLTSDPTAATSTSTTLRLSFVAPFFFMNPLNYLLNI